MGARLAFLPLHLLIGLEAALDDLPRDEVRGQHADEAAHEDDRDPDVVLVDHDVPA